ncbi:MAG: Gfo/Idh/MocA family protein [Pseudolabrys sp.]
MSASDAAEKRVRLGFCGCGWVVRHCYRPALARLQSDFDVTAVFDPAPVARHFAAEAWPAARYCATFDELLAVRPAALIVASPNALHVDHAAVALAAGISCLVEKPAVRDTADVARLLAARKPGATLMSAVASRYRRDTQAWLAAVSALGPLAALDLTWTREQGVPATPWHLRRDGGWTGVFADLGYHLLDLAGAALHWPGADIDVLSVRSASQKQAVAAGWYRQTQAVAYDTDDRFEAAAAIGGCTLRIRVNWVDDEPGDLVRLAARAARGEAVLEGLFGFSDNRRTAEQRVLLRGDGAIRETHFPAGPQLQLEAFENLLRDFHAAVRAGSAAIPPELTFVGRLAGALRAKNP